MERMYLAIVLGPLIAALLAGLFGRQIGRTGAHVVTILGVAASFVMSLMVLKAQWFDGAPAWNGSVYTWAVVDGVTMEVGFLIDRLSALMMVVVTSVSLMVHVYTIGYMHDDPGYQRFFSYISLFTFAMLMLVMANNFLQLFFGWEAVGLVSYLLIGFWYTRPTAIFANLKAFLVNRVGDFGFLLGIALVLMATGSLDYATVFLRAPEVSAHTIEVWPGTAWPVMTVTCILLFVGRDGQVGADAVARVAAGLHGGPHADLGIDPCGDHGDRRRFHGGAHVAAVRAFGNRVVRRAGDRGNHGAVYRLPRGRAERHQAGCGVLDAVTAGVYDGSARRVGLRRRCVSPDDPCVLQGAAVPGGRLGDHCHASRAGHPEDGRAAQVPADNLGDQPHRHTVVDRVSRLFGILLQGCPD